ncbi:hypothetical protein R1flu_024006 [Riccia fluitans]|uniref:Reverse transcriptase domain-containing protein n=1 Tax=Riccia fluitans TaxID=41844 RepID=A0ABD1XU46_9MARC
MAYLLGASRLLVLEKSSGGVRPIAVDEVDIRNAFNTVSHEALFYELHAAIGSLDQLFPFVRSFYAHCLSLYISHCSRKDEVSLLLSKSCTCQGDPLGGTLFALAHLRAFRIVASDNTICLFPSLADDTHIVGPPEAVMVAFHALEGHLLAVGLIVQPTKCVAWSPSGLPSSLSLPQVFHSLLQGFEYLALLLDQIPFRHHL